MTELQIKVKNTIERIKAFQPPEGYHLAFSGGKDSVVCKALLDMAGVKYDAHYRLTSVDPPDLVRFIKKYHPDVSIDVPHYPDYEKDEKLRGKPITMWNLIPKKRMPPTRLARYCCQYLKEDSGDGRMVVTGVRWEESSNRRLNQGVVTVMSPQKATKDELLERGFQDTKRGGVILVNDNDESRRTLEHCYKRSKVTLNPIIEWSNSDVWSFIREYDIPYCSLYDEGWTRLGCIGCPMASRNERERAFARWPTYKVMYLKAFGKMLSILQSKSNYVVGRMGSTPQDVFNWWMEYDLMPGQVSFDELEAMSEEEELI